MTPRKNSKKRGAILECIRSTKTHPSAEWIYTSSSPASRISPSVRSTATSTFSSRRGS